MRILWHSNAPWAPTGYGRQTALFAPLLAKHYDLFLSANYGLDAAPIMWRNIPVMPGLGQTTARDHPRPRGGDLRGAPRRAGADAVRHAAVRSRVFKRMNVACWTPVDHAPVSPAVVAFLRGSQAIPIAMSRFGQEELAEFDPLYVPHGVDTEVFKPTESDIREQMGLDRGRLPGRDGGGEQGPAQSRKCFQQAFEAFRHFHEKHENACLYVHTTVAPEYAEGEDLLALAASLEIPEDRFKFPNQYTMIHAPITDEKMAEVYSAFDVLLNPSMGEGFGVPILEARLAGSPRSSPTSRR